MQGEIQSPEYGYLFCSALNHGPLLGHFELVYCAITLSIIRFVKITHSEKKPILKRPLIEIMEGHKKIVKVNPL